jgi:hypothetical protein
LTPLICAALNYSPIPRRKRAKAHFGPRPLAWQTMASDSRLVDDHFEPLIGDADRSVPALAAARGLWVDRRDTEPYCSRR